MRNKLNVIEDVGFFVAMWFFSIAFCAFLLKVAVFFIKHFV